MSLQPFEYDPSEKNKHKFMVQSMFAPDGEINQDTLVLHETMWTTHALYYTCTGLHMIINDIK